MSSKVESNSAASRPGVGIPRDYTANLYARFRSSIRRSGRRSASIGTFILGDLAAAYAAESMSSNFVSRLFSVDFRTPPNLSASYIIVFFIFLGCYAEWGLSPVDRLRARAVGTMIYLAINISVMFSTLSLRTLSELTCTSVLLVIFGYYAECAVRKFLVRKQLLGAPTLLVGRRGDHGLVEVQATLPEAGFRPIGFVECKGDTIARDLHAPSFFASSGKDPSAIDDSEVTLLLAHDQAISEGGAGLKGLPFAHVVLLPEVGDKLSTVGVPVHLFEGVTGFEVTQTIHKSGSLFVKRGVDLLLGTPLLILAAPIILISAVAVKIIDPGPGLYQQQRVGKDGRLIKVPKLRTMYANAEALLQEHLSKDPAARLEWEKYCKLSNDPRVLPFIGTFLRRTSLDELPQLFNAVAGTMSLVGPRPFPEYHLDRFDDAFRTMRMSVPPGLTGFWQVSARSDGDLCIQKIQDTYYIQNWSIWLDLWILLQTVPAVIAGRGAR